MSNTMCRTYIAFLGLLALLLLGSFSATTAHAQIGFAIGANFNELSDIDSDPPATFDNATGFHIGVFYDLGVGPVALRPGLFYMDAGDFDANGPSFDDQSFDLQFIEIPVDVRFNVLTAPIVRPYVLAGPVFRFAQTSDDDFKDSLNDFSYAANVGFGLEIGSPVGGITLYPEFRYAFGISSITDDSEFLGANFTADEDQQFNAFMLRLGVSF
jgi:hypothetical protein